MHTFGCVWGIVFRVDYFCLDLFRYVGFWIWAAFIIVLLQFDSAFASLIAVQFSPFFVCLCFKPDCAVI